MPMVGPAGLEPTVRPVMSRGRLPIALRAYVAGFPPLGKIDDFETTRNYTLFWSMDVCGDNREQTPNGRSPFEGRCPAFAGGASNGDRTRTASLGS